MQIRNFKNVRVNDENFLDVKSFGGHSDYGVMVTAYDFASEVVEVRRKEGRTSLFAYKFGDIELSDYWKDAEVIFTTRK
ncbi:hypothetical protein BhaS171_00040 [Bacillus phage vB_BhaS-171]|uniref:hypothetical protein n=1 Tax=Bacillus phage vB_BhaS-171 TaxID=1775140 RepID=UPI000744C3FA|nr:hypothetical protein BH781_gp40 [Bacillus phage vB_BhaS-171]ALY08096.1 hypothetical protein BhaS171_00040 [Bacillus phage vB_BhaS-171]